MKLGAPSENVPLPPPHTKKWLSNPSTKLKNTSPKLLGAAEISSLIEAPKYVFASVGCIRR